ncbi:MAG: CaiB/BaiF CoA transferase family protein [Lautropia sp.]
MEGVLSGIRVVELAAIGPIPWAMMLAADMGASVIRITRPGTADDVLPTARGRVTVELDLKSEAGLDTCKRFLARADVLVEGMRPGALERLGLAPEVCHSINPALVIGRMTGWGQAGPMAALAGHDINYIALNGVLHAVGRDRPTPPLNLVADFGGGGTFLLIGILSALLSARRTRRGEVVDAAMIDGSASLSTMVYERLMQGRWSDRRGTNSLDGGTPWYDVYATSDGCYMAVGCNEPHFYEAFLDALGLDPATLPGRHAREQWPALRAAFAQRFAQRTRAEWIAVFDGVDACVTPVLSLLEAPEHPHNAARGTYMCWDGHPIPSPAPRFVGRPNEPAARSAKATPEEALATWSPDPPARVLGNAR